MQGLRLGTRASPLALAQARKVAAAIETSQRWPEGWVQIVEITTTGDKVQDRPLAEIGGKGLWTKELDRALLAEEVDFCVHSMKDIESIRPGNRTLRPSARAATSAIGSSVLNRSKSSLRGPRSERRRPAERRSSCGFVRTYIVPIRGNVQTRLRKVEAGEVDATLLAAAGLKRLEISAGTAIPTEIILPAPGQAVIAMECRTNDTRTQSVLTTVNNQITYDCVMSEREFTRALFGDCSSPVAHLRPRRWRPAHAGATVQRGRGRDDRGSSGVRLWEFDDPRRSGAITSREGAGSDPEAVPRPMKRVLVLRPEPGASTTVKHARERGLDAIAIPLFEIEPVAWDVPEAGGYDGLLLTSANAIRHGGKGLNELRGLPVHAVGAATAKAARDARFRHR